MNTYLKKLGQLGLFLTLIIGNIPYTFAKDIYLVRHFEKQKPTEQTGKDVNLTEIGNTNAKRLAHWMLEKNLRYLFTTNYNRTKQSIHATAMATKIEPVIYDPNRLDAFAKELKLLEGNALVLGHSNTTGVLYALLGCEEVLLSEDDYGDIFKVSVNPINHSIACERFDLYRFRK